MKQRSCRLFCFRPRWRSGVVLHGGAGSDHFEFSPGRDVIDDFDACGGGTKQDHLVGNFDDVHFHRSGADLVLSMDDGSSLVLLHTKMSAISAADFELF